MLSYLLYIALGILSTVGFLFLVLMLWLYFNVEFMEHE